jgi:hypothetical protein
MSAPANAQTIDVTATGNGATAIDSCESRSLRIGVIKGSGPKECVLLPSGLEQRTKKWIPVCGKSDA